MAFAAKLVTLGGNPTQQNTDTENCEFSQYGGSPSGDCCHKNGLMTWYNTNLQQCCPDKSLKNVGELC
jgi:hypothetical protein